MAGRRHGDALTVNTVQNREAIQIRHYLTSSFLTPAASAVGLM